MGEEGFYYTSQGVKITPERISAEILKKVVKDAERAVNEPIKDVVISVPAYFGQAQMSATIAAGKEAGLNVISLVPEPAAAAFAYSKHKDADKRDKIVLVYDLGGGTFDVTMVEIIDDNVRGLATAGIHNLGGKNWNEKLAEHVASEFCKQTHVTHDEIKHNSKFFKELNQQVENAKTDLSSTDLVTITLSYKDKDAEIEVTKKKFDDLTRGLLLETIHVTDEVIKDAKKKMTIKGVPCNDYDLIIFAGGSTRMTQIEEIIREKYKKPIFYADPDVAVAKGAALYAMHINKIPPPAPDRFDIVPVNGSNLPIDSKTLRQIAKEQGIWKITGKSYGVEANDDYGIRVLSNIIMKNTPIPCSNTRGYRTKEANLNNVEIIICESNLTESSCVLKDIKKENLKSTIFPLPSGLPLHAPIDITFDIDINGILTATAVELTEGRRCTVQINLNRLDNREIMPSRNGVSV